MFFCFFLIQDKWYEDYQTEFFLTQNCTLNLDLHCVLLGI